MKFFNLSNNTIIMKNSSLANLNSKLKFVFCLSAFLVLFTNINYAQYPQPQYVGISSSQMNYYASAQRNSQWCWAASIQMVLNYYGVAISQEQIVARTYGTDPYGHLPNWAGSIEAITKNLNNWNIDNYGTPYIVMASLNWGAPTPAVLVQELSNGRPVIIGYSGHAVVVTAVSFVNSYRGPIIQSIVVRDPWPSQKNVLNSGRVEHPALNLASHIMSYWYIRVN